MSTYWGYVCLDHEPPLRSEEWFNHGEDTLERFLRAFRAGGYTVEHYPLPSIEHRGYSTEAPAWWLANHPNCRVALGNEYGEIHEVTL